MDNIAIYQAARTALAINRKRFDNLPSAYGRPCGKKEHLFPEFPQDEDKCKLGIKEVVEKYNKERCISSDDVIQTFDSLLSDFKKTGKDMRIIFIRLPARI